MGWFTALARHDAIEGGKVRPLAARGEIAGRIHRRQLFRHCRGDELVDAGAVGLGDTLDFGP
ncbi:MAG: hypothetical protein WDN06_02770 [Asticcacaulis sp.]